MVAELQQIGMGINCLQDETQYSIILRPIAVASKCLSTVEKRHSNIEREAEETHID